MICLLAKAKLSHWNGWYCGHWTCTNARSDVYLQLPLLGAPRGKTLQISVLRTATLPLTKLAYLYPLNMESLVWGNQALLLASAVNYLSMRFTPNVSLYTTWLPPLFYFCTFTFSHSIYEKAVNSTSKIHLNPSISPSPNLLLISTAMTGGTTSISILDHLDRPLAALLHAH